MKYERRKYAESLSLLVYGTTSRWKKVMKNYPIGDEQMIEVMEKMRDVILKSEERENGRD